jgi:hypothetical protein
MPRPLSSRRTTHRLAADAGLLAVAAAFMLPLAWVLLSSLDTNADLRVKVPDGVTFDNFDAVLTPEITFTPLLNSLLLCGGGTLLTVVCAALAAYPLSRFRSRLNRPFLLTILFATSLPITAIMVPVYALFVQDLLLRRLPTPLRHLADEELHGRRTEGTGGGGVDGRGVVAAVADADRAAADGAGVGGSDRLLVRDDVGELFRSVHAAAYAGSDAGGGEHQ